MAETNLTVDDAINTLIDTSFGGDNESQMKAVQFLKFLATSDDPKANEFMKKLDKATSNMKVEELHNKLDIFGDDKDLMVLGESLIDYSKSHKDFLFRYGMDFMEGDRSSLTLPVIEETLNRLKKQTASTKNIENLNILIEILQNAANNLSLSQ